MCSQGWESKQWFSKCISRPRSIWEPVNNANSQLHLSPPESETLAMGPSGLHFKDPPRDSDVLWSWRSCAVGICSLPHKLLYGSRREEGEGRKRRGLSFGGRGEGESLPHWQWHCFWVSACLFEDLMCMYTLSLVRHVFQQTVASDNFCLHIVLNKTEEFILASFSLHFFFIYLIALKGILTWQSKFKRYPLFWPDPGDLPVQKDQLLFGKYSCFPMIKDGWEQLVSFLKTSLLGDVLQCKQVLNQIQPH